MPKKPKLPDGMYERNGVYYSRFRKDGRQVRKRLSTDFKAACEMLRDLRARADKAGFNLLDNDYGWDELKAEFLRWARQAVRNPDDYERDLKRIEQFRKVGSIRQVDHAYVIAYRQWRLSQEVGNVVGKPRKGSRVSPRTANREISTLQNMLNKGVDWKRLGTNPIKDIKPLRHDDLRKQRRALTVDEVTAIFREAPAFLRPVLRMFATTGLRREELVSLLFSDIDFENRTVGVRANVAKSKKRRDVPLDDETFAMLVELRDGAKHREPIAGVTPEGKFTRDHVFTSQANTPLRNNLLRSFYTVCKRAGIEGAHSGGSVDLHSMRVTFATLAIEHGANPRAIQASLGHATLNMTMGIYAKATERSKREALASLPYASVTTPAHIVPMRSEHKVSTSDIMQSQTLAGNALKTGT